jgi:L-cysteine desulfidase
MPKMCQPLNSETIFKILKREVLPSLGCTELSAVAIAVNTAFNAASDNLKIVDGKPAVKRRLPAEVVLKTVRSVELLVDKNTFKNSASVGIPNSEGRKGIKVVSTLALFGDAGLGLAFFESVSKRYVKFIDRLKVAVKVRVKNGKTGAADIFIEADVKLKGGRVAVARIEHWHTNLTYVKVGRKIVFEGDRRVAGRRAVEGKKRRYFKNLTVSEMIAYVEDLPRAAVELVRKGILLNSKLSKVGLKDKKGAGVGYALNRLAEATGNVPTYVKARVAAGCDARMYGELLPAVSVAGSGNQGIVATMPIVAYGKRTMFDEDKLVKAVALSYIISIYATYHSSYLSAACGFAKAGLGAAAGLAYYMTDGNRLAVERSMQNFIANVPGMICDGGKTGCAVKAGTVADASLQSASLAKEGCVIPSQDGILGETAEDSVRNMAKVFRAMSPVDRVVVKILSSKQSNG